MSVDRLFWLTFKNKRGTQVFIAQAGSLMMARVKASMAGMEGDCKEAHQLDVETARKIPARVIGRLLSREEAERLLKRLG